MKKARNGNLTFFVLISAIVHLLLIFVSLAPGQVIKPKAHPNHYIVLIDSSGSTISSNAKKKIYEKALDKLTSNLFQSGFGDAIPAYEADQDFLSLHHFGVVTGGQTAAYAQLNNYDLLTQFIHSAFVRKQGVKEVFFKQSVVPSQTYQYTILSWAKQIALQNSKPEHSDDPANQTFLILVHDGLANENSLAEEVEMVRRWNRSGYEKTSAVVNSINADYRFSDGRGDNQPAWSETVSDSDGNSGTPVFIEAYEVIPIDQADWENTGKDLKPVSSTQFQWVKESGSSPEGTLKFNLNNDFQTWLSSSQVADTFINIKQKEETVSRQGLEIPVSFDRELTCSENNFKAELNVVLTRTDKLLGQRTVVYTYAETIVPPGSTGCTAGYFISRGVFLLIIAAIFAGVIYYFYYRFYATHFEIEIPGTILPIHLKRQNKTYIQVPILPQNEMEAFSVKLPSFFLQNLFYRHATIKLESENKNINWANEHTDFQIKLPLERKYILARWNSLSEKPSPVTLIYKQGRQQMEVVFTYPGSINPSEENIYE